MMGHKPIARVAGEERVWVDRLRGGICTYRAFHEERYIFIARLITFPDEFFTKNVFQIQN